MPTATTTTTTLSSLESVIGGWRTIPCHLTWDRKRGINPDVLSEKKPLLVSCFLLLLTIWIIVIFRIFFTLAI